jgi:hypothetical protein
MGRLTSPKDHPISMLFDDANITIIDRAAILRGES